MDLSWICCYLSARYANNYFTIKDPIAQPPYQDNELTRAKVERSFTLYMSMRVTDGLCQAREVSPRDSYQVWGVSRCCITERAP